MPAPDTDTAISARPTRGLVHTAEDADATTPSAGGLSNGSSLNGAGLVLPRTKEAVRQAYNVHPLVTQARQLGAFFDARLDPERTHFTYPTIGVKGIGVVVVGEDGNRRKVFDLKRDVLTDTEDPTTNGHAGAHTERAHFSGALRLPAGTNYRLLITYADGSKVETADPHARHLTHGVRSIGDKLYMAQVIDWAKVDHILEQAPPAPELPKDRGTINCEVLISTGADNGNFVGLKSRLPQMAEDGVDRVVLISCHATPDVTSQGIGITTWGYDPACLSAPRTSYGSIYELAELVAEAHKLGLRVMLDVVYNHLGPEGDLYRLFIPPHVLHTSEHSPWSNKLSDHELVHQTLVGDAQCWIAIVDDLRHDAFWVYSDLLSEKLRDGLSAIKPEMCRLLEDPKGPYALKARGLPDSPQDLKYADDFWKNVLLAIMLGEQNCHGFLEHFKASTYQHLAAGANQLDATSLVCRTDHDGNGNHYPFRGPAGRVQLIHGLTDEQTLSLHHLLWMAALYLPGHKFDMAGQSWADPAPLLYLRTCLSRRIALGGFDEDKAAKLAGRYGADDVERESLKASDGTISSLNELVEQAKVRPETRAAIIGLRHYRHSPETMQEFGEKLSIPAEELELLCKIEGTQDEVKYLEETGDLSPETAHLWRGIAHFGVRTGRINELRKLLLVGPNDPPERHKEVEREIEVLLNLAIWDGRLESLPALTATEDGSPGRIHPDTASKIIENDPFSPEALARCLINPQLSLEGNGLKMRTLYREAIRDWRSSPSLSHPDRSFTASSIDNRVIALEGCLPGHPARVLVANFSPFPQRVPLERIGRDLTLLDYSTRAFNLPAPAVADGFIDIPPWSGVTFEKRPLQLEDLSFNRKSANGRSTSQRRNGQQVNGRHFKG